MPSLSAVRVENDFQQSCNPESKYFNFRLISSRISAAARVDVSRRGQSFWVVGRRHASVLLGGILSSGLMLVEVIKD